MIPLILDGAPAWLLDTAPSWGDGVDASLSIASALAQSLRNQEERFALGHSLRWTLRYTVTAGSQDARMLDMSFRRYRDEPVLVPLWPFGIAWSKRANRLVTGGLYVIISELGSGWELFAATEPEPKWPEPTDQVYPVLVGYLSRRQLNWRHADLAQASIEFVEQSEIKYQVQSTITHFTKGPLPGPRWLSSPYLFPFAADHGEIDVAQEVVVHRDTVGFGRQATELAREHKARVHANPPVVIASGANVASLIGFYATIGTASPFWQPGWFNALRLGKGEVGPTSLPITDAADAQVGDMLTTLNGPAWSGRVTSIASEYITTDTNTGPLMQWVNEGQPIVITHLRLARFDADRLSIRWRTSELATLNTPIVEIPNEADLELGENIGETIGTLAPRAYLFWVRNEITSSFYTSFESPITHGGQMYQPVKLGHSDAKQGLALDLDNMAIRVELNAIPAFRDMATLRNETPIWVTLTSVELDAALATSNPVILFDGEVGSAKITGNLIQVQASPGGYFLDRLVPRFRIKPDCNHELYSPGCVGPDGITARERWRFNAVVDTHEFFTLKLRNVLHAGGGGAPIFAHYFSGGWLDFGSDATRQRRAIVDSTELKEGRLDITLSRDPDPIPEAGTAVQIFPGCDGIRETCINKFGNYNNFGAHPFVPLANPTIIPARPSGAGGKK